MDELRLAVKQLLNAGKILLPEALEVLRSLKNPSSVAINIIKEEPLREVINREIIIKYKTFSTVHNSKLKKVILEKQINSRKNRLLHTLLKENLLTNQNKTQQSRKPVSAKTIIQTSLDDLQGLINYESELKIIREPNLSSNLSGKIEDIVGYFQSRYSKLSKLFFNRSDITELTSIRNMKQNHNQISLIGLLTHKVLHSNSSGKLVIEDPTYERTVEVVIVDDEILVEKCLQLMLDSVICVKGSVKNEVFFAQEVYLPEIPLNRELETADIPVHVAFLSDIHVGSKNFLAEPMENFVKFLNGEYGTSKLRRLGEQTKYLLFSGDVVDGVGIYPNQQDDLELDSIHDQYNVFASFIDKIPEEVEIVIIPGNHDMVRSAEPQPRIQSEFAPDLVSLKNVKLLPNPSQISIHGVQSLMYHCTSLPDIINHIPGLTINKPVDVMKHMLKARHLAPIWGDKTPIATEPVDHLIIDPIPDIFHGGHVHINGEGSYRGVQIINSGTMQKQTNFQKSLNIEPTPGQITLMNLKDRKMSRIDFMSSY